MSSPSKSYRTLTYAQALYEGTRQEMERDPSVYILGLGVDDARGMYGTTLDLQKVFGPDRNFDTPLSEDAMTGVAIGSALAGMRPIHVHQRMDFLLLCMNQLVNIAAKKLLYVCWRRLSADCRACRHRPQLGAGRPAQPGLPFLFHACARPQSRGAGYAA